MRQLKFLAATLLICTFSFGQTIKIQTGVSVSNLDWKDIYDDWSYNDNNLIGLPIFIGVDYLEKKYFSLSSNIGLLRKGGSITKFVPDELRNLHEGGLYEDPVSAYPFHDLTTVANIDYLSFNTTCDFNYPLKNNVTPFIGLGPRIDLLLDNVDIYNKCSYGLLFGGGLKYNMKKIQVGLRFDYYLNLNDIYKTELNGTLSDKTFTTNLIIGYRLK